MAGDLKTQIQITADASGVEAGVGKAKRSLADLGTAAKSAGQQASQGLAGAGDGGAGAATKIDRATQNIIGSIQRTAAAMSAGGKTTSDYFRLLASQRGISTETLAPYLEQLDAASVKTKAAGHALEGLSFSSAAAKRELLVLTHELSQGNYSRFAGSLQVLGERTGAASLLFSGLGLAIVGVTATIGAFIAAAAIGANESNNLAKALILSGNAAGATATGLATAAKGIASITGSQHEAAEALTALAGSGAVAGESLEKFGLVAVKLSRDAGIDIAETVKRFEELGKSPVDASAKLNESLHYLTASTFEQIKSLQDQGKAAQAAAAAQDAYANAMLSRTSEIESRLGSIERAWHGIIGAAKSAWNAMLDIGREQTIGQQLDAAGKAVQAAQDRINGAGATGSKGFANRGVNYGGTDAMQEQLKQATELRDSLTRRVLLEDKVATAARVQAEQGAASVKWAQEGDKFLTKQQQMQKAITAAQNEGVAAGKSQRDIDERIAAIRENYAEKGATPRNTDRNELALDIEKIKEALAGKIDAYRNAQLIFDSLRAAGLKSDKQYFEQERIGLELNEAANVKALDEQIAERRGKTFTGEGAENNRLANEKELLKLLQERSKVQADTAVKSTVIDTQEAAAFRQRQANYTAADQAAERQLDATQRQYDLDLALARLAPLEAQRLAGRAQITEKYASDLQNAQNAYSRLPKGADGKAANANEQEAYDRDIARIGKFRDAALAEYDRYYQRRKAQDADYYVGLDRATSTYIENAQNVAKLTEQAYTNVFSSIEDALVTFVTTGKLNFKSLADSIISEFVRIEAKAAISKVLGSVNEAGGFAGFLGKLGGAYGGSDAAVSGGAALTATGFTGFATGGYAGPGTIHEVNERGPELLQVGTRTLLMMGGSEGGRVVPHEQSFSMPKIINQTTGRIDQATMVSTGPNPEDRALLLQESADHVARQLYDPNSSVSRAMKRNVKAERVR